MKSSVKCHLQSFQHINLHQCSISPSSSLSISSSLDGAVASVAGWRRCTVWLSPFQFQPPFCCVSYHVSPPISSLPPRLLLSNKGSYATKHNLATLWRKQAVVKRFGMLFKSYHMALPWHYIPHAGSGICLSSSWNNSSQQRRQSVPQNRKLDRNRSSHFIPNKNKARATREH